MCTVTRLVAAAERLAMCEGNLGRAHAKDRVADRVTLRLVEAALLAAFHAALSAALSAAILAAIHSSSEASSPRTARSCRSRTVCTASCAGPAVR